MKLFQSLIIHKQSLLGFILVCSGCNGIASFDDFAKGWVGEPIQRMIEAAKRPRSDGSFLDVRKLYRLENGNWVYTTVDNEDCVIHWEVNEQNVIVGYRGVGNRCE